MTFSTYGIAFVCCCRWHSWTANLIKITKFYLFYNFIKVIASYPYFSYIWYIFMTITVQSTPTLHWKLSIAALKLRPIKEQQGHWTPHLSKPKVYVWINKKSLGHIAASVHPAFSQPDVKTSASESSVVKAIHTLRFRSKLY